MAQTPIRKWRGTAMEQEKLWLYQIKKEDELRLKWFKNNEPRLHDIANRENLKTVPESIKQELNNKLLSNVQNVEKHKKPLIEDTFNLNIDERALRHIMRPVPKEVTDLIYASRINDGRITYLKERYKIIPEQRYYFPETTNFNYGWNMSQHSKGMGASKFARQQVIRDSFYRRRGVEKDPEWYKEPARLSPNVCGCL